MDTGEGKPSWAACLRRVLSDEKATVERAILTHWHPDHVGGVDDLLRIAPEAKVHKNEPTGRQLDIHDGQRFQVGGATLRAFHSPGHTTDHMALVLEQEDAMLTGDNVLGHRTAVFEDLSTYLASLDKMRHQFAGRAYPGHGAVIDDGKAKILEYIAHRQQREDQVLEVLKSEKDPAEAGRSTDWGSMEMVKIIYKDVPESLHLPAERGLLQVLSKLQREDKVLESNGRWRLNDKAVM